MHQSHFGWSSVSVQNKVFDISETLASAEEFQICRLPEDNFLPNT
jgi:hypothetical protein